MVCECGSVDWVLLIFVVFVLELDLYCWLFVWWLGSFCWCSVWIWLFVLCCVVFLLYM